MTLITLRPIAKRPPERHVPRRSIHPLEDAPHGDTPISGNFLRGQQTYLSGRSPLRCYYYNKQARGRWSSAERSVSGMRWNAYLTSGRATPKFEPLRTERLPRVVKGLMKEIEAGSASVVAGIIAPEGARIARAKAAAARKAKESGPDAALESNVVRISVHARFRHLRAVRDERGAEAAARTDESKVTEIRARKDKTQAVTPDAVTRAHHQHEPSPGIGTMDQRGEREGTARPDVRLRSMAPAARGPSRQEMRPETAAENVRHGSSPLALKDAWEPQRPGGRKGMVVAIPLPGFLAAGAANDNHPGPEPIVPAVMASSCCQAASIAVDTIPPRRGIGYFSSSRRRSFQLKIALGAAALPQ